MVRIIYEHPVDWPTEGPLRVNTHLQGEIAVAPDVARRRTNGYLSREVALFIIAGEPELVLGNQPQWRIPAILRLRGFGEVAIVGSLKVDALTGDLHPLSPAQIRNIRQRAHDITNRLTSAATSTS